MPTDRPRTAFISGPLEVSSAYFSRYYEPRINAAIAAGEYFVVGPVSGIDSLALSYLMNHPDVSASQIAVYMAGFETSARPDFVTELRGKGVEVMEVADATTTWDRDAAMTRASDYDILRYRTEWEQKACFGSRWRARVSNTERNERRRARSEAGDTRGEEEVEVKYIRHTSGIMEKRLQSWMRRRKDDGKEEVEECDGTCDGHGDVVSWPLLSGRTAFGFAGGVL